jgi:hypothetical protein
MGTTGRPWRSELSWTGGASPPCTGPNRLFCFSNRLVLGWDSFESGDFFRWSVAVVGDTP